MPWTGKEVRVPTEIDSSSIGWENKPWQFGNLLLGIHPDDGSIDDLGVLQ